MFSFSFLRHLARVFLPATAETSPAAHDPGSGAPIREELYRPPVLLDLAIWFEDLTEDPERVGCVGVEPAKGMNEGWFDAVLGDVVARDRRYAAAGVLSGVRVNLRADNYCQFTTVMHKVSQRLGTIPWVRNLAEPNYAEFWCSGRPLFRRQESSIGEGATTTADLTNCAIRTIEH